MDVSFKFKNIDMMIGRHDRLKMWYINKSTKGDISHVHTRSFGHETWPNFLLAFSRDILCRREKGEKIGQFSESKNLTMSGLCVGWTFGY